MSAKNCTTHHNACDCREKMLADDLAALRARCEAAEKERDAIKARPVLRFIIGEEGPGPEAGRFIEVEDADGHSVNAGQWAQQEDGTWALTVPWPTGMEAEWKSRAEKAKDKLARVREWGERNNWMMMQALRAILDEEPT